MNQELKNFDMLIVELETTFKNSEYQAFKTLLNIYIDIYNEYSNTHFKNITKSGVGDILVSHNEVLENVEELLLKKDFPKLTSEGDYKSLHVVQQLIVKLKEINYYMNKKVKKYLEAVTFTKLLTDGFKNAKIISRAETLLSKSIEGGFLITQVTEDLRGTGKTKSLIKKAHELDVTLVVGLHSTKRLVDEKAYEMGISIDCKYANNTNALRGYKFKNNKFLVDDSVPNLLIRELINQGKEFVGGFNSLNDSLSTIKQPTILEHLHKKLNNLINQRDVINTTHKGRSHLMPQWIELNRKIEVVSDLIDEEAYENKSTIKTSWKIEKDGSNILKGKMTIGFED